MPNPARSRVLLRSLAALLIAFAVSASVGCHAQPPADGKLSPELARRVELLIRARTKMPPDFALTIGARRPSDVPGFDTIDVAILQDGSPSTPISFLLSTDGKTLAQLNKYDISRDPKALVSAAGRPARGGPEGAPVDIVVFDDLECPFCSKMHAQIFPALLDRYGKQVRVVYRDFPIAQHPWAMRAAVDTNCVAPQSSLAYWNMVDYIHAHASDFGGAEKSLEKANGALDQLALDQSAALKLDTTEVQACLKKQDDTSIKASLKLGEDLGVEATPVLFINGEKLEGAYPLVDVFRMIDGALLAAGRTPPPPYVAPAPPAPAPAPKPGS